MILPVAPGLADQCKLKSRPTETRVPMKRCNVFGDGRSHPVAEQSSAQSEAGSKVSAASRDPQSHIVTHLCSCPNVPSTSALQSRRVLQTAKSFKEV